MTLARSLAPILTAASLLSAGCAERLSYEGQALPLMAAAAGLPTDALPAARPPGRNGPERIALHLSEGMSPHERVKVLTAIDDWNVALNGVLGFGVVTGKQVPAAKSTWRIVVVREPTGPRSNGGTPLAETYRSWLGGGVVRIYAGNLKTNDLAAVMRHELGHVLGLDHNEAGLMAAQYSSSDMQCIDKRTLSVLAARRHVPAGALRWCD